jgi:hypothetical protein
MDLSAGCEYVDWGTLFAMRPAIPIQMFYKRLWTGEDILVGTITNFSGKA